MKKAPVSCEAGASIGAGETNRTMVLPFETSKTDETFLVLKSEERTKLFNLGDVLEVTSEEFSWVAWTQLEASQWAASRLEEIGKAQGLSVQAPSSSSEMPEPNLPPERSQYGDDSSPKIKR